MIVRKYFNSILASFTYPALRNLMFVINMRLRALLLKIILAITGSRARGNYQNRRYRVDYWLFVSYSKDPQLACRGHQATTLKLQEGHGLALKR